MLTRRFRSSIATHRPKDSSPRHSVDSIQLRDRFGINDLPASVVRLAERFPLQIKYLSCYSRNECTRSQ